MKPQAPCKECKDRYPGCHSRCAGYKAYKDACGAYDRQVAKMRASSDYFDERASKNVGRHKHKR